MLIQKRTNLSDTADHILSKVESTLPRALGDVTNKRSNHLKKIEATASPSFGPKTPKVSFLNENTLIELLNQRVLHLGSLDRGHGKGSRNQPRQPAHVRAAEHQQGEQLRVSVLEPAILSPSNGETDDHAAAGAQQVDPTVLEDGPEANEEGDQEECENLKLETERGELKYITSL